MKCPYCATDNPDVEHFCTNCGAYLDQSGDALTVVSNHDAIATQVANAPSPPVSEGLALTASGEEKHYYSCTRLAVTEWSLRCGKNAGPGWYGSSCTGA